MKQLRENIIVIVAITLITAGVAATSTSAAMITAGGLLLVGLAVTKILGRGRDEHR